MPRHAGASVPRYLTRDVATELRDQEPGALPDWIVRADRTPPVVMPWLCQPCHDWTEAGSYARNACTRCGTGRPT